MTLTRYKPLDVDYPTNFPTSNNIPIPSGLLQDAGKSSRLILETGLKTSIQGWAWTGARTTLSTAPGTLVPAQNFNQLTGYLNPTTTTARYDFSTVGLQVCGQIKNNKALEPVVLSIPYRFSNFNKKAIKVSISGQIFAESALSAGMGFSIGWISWDANGVKSQILPYDWSGALASDVDDEDVIFNVNPDLPITPYIKYYAPAGSITDPMRIFELEIPFEEGNFRPQGPGFILISVVSFPRSVTVPGGTGLVRGVDWDWFSRSTVVDPNHIDLTKNNFTYGDNFTDSSGSTRSQTGAKFITVGSKPLNWMIKLNPPSTVTEARSSYSYHSMLQLRPGGQPGNYNSSIGRAMIHPFIPDTYIRGTDYFNEAGWTIDIFSMPVAVITSIYIEESPAIVDGVNIYTNVVDNYFFAPTSSGSRATAFSLNQFLRNLKSSQESPVSAVPCHNRVKGHLTYGKLASFEVLEKNEAFPWMFYDPDDSYGVAEPGISFPVNYSSVNIEGFNRAESFIFVESCTPKRRSVTSSSPLFSIDNTLDGDDQALGLEITYPLSVGRQSGLAYDPNKDKTIAYMPFNQAFSTETVEQGIDESQYQKGGSFNTPSMLDRYYNDFIDPSYRVVPDFFPILDPSATEFERASGFTNNYATAGGIAYYTINSIWTTSPTSSSRINFLDEAYNTTEVKERGNLEILQVSGTNPGLRGIDTGLIFIVYGSIYSPAFTQDPS
jgi:hypothetical protein